MKRSQPGESTGYGRRFSPTAPTWIGIVPVGYGDGFRRDLTGTEVRVAGEPSARRRDHLDGLVRRRARRELPVGAPVVLLGHGVLAERHAQRRGHDQLRARVRDRVESPTRTAHGDRCLNPGSRTTTTSARVSARRPNASPNTRSSRSKPCANSCAPSSRRRGDERALDSGTGAGTLALALAPLVGEVVGVDIVPELLERARKGAPANVDVRRGRRDALPFETARSISRARGARCITSRTRSRLSPSSRASRRPAAASSSTTRSRRATRSQAFELDRFEQARDPSHTRTLPDVDFRHLFEANDLVLIRTRFQTHRRELDYYSTSPAARVTQAERARQLSPGGQSPTSPRAAGTSA